MGKEKTPGQAPGSTDKAPPGLTQQDRTMEMGEAQHTAHTGNTSRVDSEATPVEKLPNPRDAIIDSIVSHNEEQLKDDLEYIDEHGNVVIPEEEPASPAPPQVVLETKKDTPPDDRVYDLDGRKVTLDELIEAGKRELTKDLSATQRLQQANDILTGALRTRQEPEPAPQPDPDDISDEEIVELTRAIQFGNEQEAAAALKRLRAAPRQSQQLTPDAVANELMPRVNQMLEVKAQFQNAFSNFQKDYPDIFADPELLHLAEDMELYARGKGDSRPHATLYKEIGDRIYKIHGKARADGEMESKRKRKDAADTIPVAAGRKPVPQGEPDPDTGDIIREMAKARGQYID